MLIVCFEIFPKNNALLIFFLFVVVEIYMDIQEKIKYIDIHIYKKTMDQ